MRCHRPTRLDAALRPQTPVRLCLDNHHHRSHSRCRARPDQTSPERGVAVPSLEAQPCAPATTTSSLPPDTSERPPQSPHAASARHHDPGLQTTEAYRPTALGARRSKLRCRRDHHTAPKACGGGSFLPLLGPGGCRRSWHAAAGRGLAPASVSLAASPGSLSSPECSRTQAGRPTVTKAKTREAGVDVKEDG